MIDSCIYLSDSQLLGATRHTCFSLHMSPVQYLEISCPVIEHFIWIEPLLRGHLSYKATFMLSQRWPLNTGLTVYIYIWFCPIYRSFTSISFLTNLVCLSCSVELVKYFLMLKVYILILVQRRNLKRRLFKEINAPTEHTPGNASKWKTIH